VEKLVQHGVDVFAACRTAGDQQLPLPGGKKGLTPMAESISPVTRHIAMSTRYGNEMGTIQLR